MKTKNSKPVIPAQAVPKSSKPSVPAAGKLIKYEGPGSSALPKMTSKTMTYDVRKAPLTHPKCK